MIVTKITTHVPDALNRLLEQYKGKPKIQAIITSLVKGIQDLEDALYALDQYQQLAYSFGAQLDGIGEIVGLERNGLNDTEYLIFLYGTIAENNSDTTSTVVRYVAKTLFQAQNVFIHTPNSCPGKTLPARIGLSVGSPQTELALYSEVEQAIQNTAGAGIAIDYIWEHDAAGAFAMAGPQAWTSQVGPPTTPDALNPWPFGFGDLNNPYVGGPFASLITQRT